MKWGFGTDGVLFATNAQTRASKRSSLVWARMIMSTKSSSFSRRSLLATSAIAGVLGLVLVAVPNYAHTSSTANTQVTNAVLPTRWPRRHARCAGVIAPGLRNSNSQK